MAGILIDTNILIYAHDPREPEKQKRALSLLDELQELGEGSLSVQSLSEFYSVSTKKLVPKLTHAEAAGQVAVFVAAWPIIELTARMVLTATRAVREHQLSFWDAQLWAAAYLNQLDILLSEDLSNKQTIEGVRILDPFQPNFKIGDWI
ncbi:MAG: PIN domain-containing protein [Candidatus Sumerlaeaceae bacterium]